MDEIVVIHKDGRVLTEAQKEAKRRNMKKWAADNPDAKRDRDAKYRAANIERERADDHAYYLLKSEKVKARAQEWRKANPERRKLSSKDYYEANKAKIQEFHRAYSRTNRDKVCASKRRRYRESPQVKLAVLSRTRLARVLKNESRTKGAALALLGCSLEEATAHIESLFLPGMTWRNWAYNGWHLDHKKPLAFFDLTDPDQLKEACHYSNLQPLWWRDNLSKARKPQPSVI